MLQLSKIIFTTLLITIIVKQSIAQPNKYKFDQIGIEQGLSQSTVYAITQGKYGFMWFGTDDGLNRYDGYSIKVYKNKPDDSNSISDNRITCLLSDSKGDLWVGTQSRGVNRYVIAENKFYRYLHNDNDSLTISNNSITSMFEDSTGDIWIGTNYGLNYYKRKDNSFRHFFFDLKVPSVLNGNSITVICEDQDNNIWFGTNKGLFRYNLKKDFEFTKIHNLNVNHSTLYGDNVTSIYIDRKGVLWVSTYDQFLKHYDKKNNSFYQHTNTIKNAKTIYEDSNGKIWIGSVNTSLRILDPETNNILKIPEIQIDPINVLYKDKFGILWIGTSFRGIFVYGQNKNRFNHYLDNPDNPNVVMAFLEDRDGGLWVGTYGNGLKYFNSKRDEIVTYKYDPDNPKSISSDKIFALYITSDGIIWIGTIGGGLNYFDKSTGIFKQYVQNSPVDSKGLSNNDITALYETDNGNLMIGNAAGGIDILDRKTKRFKHYYSEEQSPYTIGSGKSVTVIQKDENRTIWAGTLNGLKLFDSKLNSFVNYSLNTKSYNQDTNNKKVTSLLFAENIIWIGTSGNGLLKLDSNIKSVSSITVNDGLSDNVVLGILSDNSGNLWLSTNKGISKFDPKKETFRNYDVSDGLQSNEFNQGAYYRSANGEMFFGGINGFNAFFPDEIEDNKFIPPIYLTTFSVFNETLNLPNPIPNNYTIELSYFQNFFSFEFVALNFTSPEKNEYAYILEGFDNNWHYVSAQQRYASYTNLNPGEYRLKIKGSNNDGIWNEEGTQVTIIVTPPYWMTWWFRSIGVLFLISISFFVYHKRISALQKDKNLQQEISSRLIERQEVERRRIALEMHDSVGQDLLLVKNRLNLTVQKYYTLDEADSPEIKKIKSTTSHQLNQISDDVSGVLKNVREISHNLRPPDLDQLGLTETIQSILLSMRKSTYINVTGRIDNINELIPKDLEINFVRIVQEALGNIIKHAEASECKVLITRKDESILLEIEDNGKGFNINLIKNKKNNINSNEYGAGLGLTGMTERVRILKGSFKVDSQLSKGTRIEIKIPVKEFKDI